MTKRRYDTWKEEEVEFLKVNLGKTPKTKMSLVLGRTVPAINQKLRLLGLETKSRNPHIISHVEDKKKEFYKVFKNKLIGGNYDRDTLRTTVRNKIRSRINRQVREDSGRVT
jgi:hypothetical protein